MWVIFLSSWKDLNYQPAASPPHDDLKCPSVQFLVNLCGAAGVHAERLRCGGGLGGLVGHMGMQIWIQDHYGTLVRDEDQ